MKQPCEELGTPALSLSIWSDSLVDGRLIGTMFKVPRETTQPCEELGTPARSLMIWSDSLLNGGPIGTVLFVVVVSLALKWRLMK